MTEFKVIKEATETNQDAEKDLRDHFAGLAMQGMMTYIDVWNQGVCHADHIASLSYTMADAMLKARKEAKP